MPERRIDIHLASESHSLLSEEVPSTCLHRGTSKIVIGTNILLGFLLLLFTFFLKKNAKKALWLKGAGKKCVPARH